MTSTVPAQLLPTNITSCSAGAATAGAADAATTAVTASPAINGRRALSMDFSRRAMLPCGNAQETGDSHASIGAGCQSAGSALWLIYNDRGGRGVDDRRRAWRRVP